MRYDVAVLVAAVVVAGISLIATRWFVARGPRRAPAPIVIQRALSFISLSEFRIPRKSLSLLRAEDRPGATILTFRVKGDRTLVDVVIKDDLPVGIESHQ